MTRTEQRHVPVLLTEALQYLAVRPGATVVDCTVGLGGHSEAIVRRLGAEGKLIGFDRDPEAMKLARERLQRVCRELGSEAPALELIDEAFSTVDEHVQAGSADASAGGFWSEQPATG